MFLPNSPSTLLDQKVIATATLRINGQKYYENRYQISCDQIDESQGETYYSYTRGNDIKVKFNVYDRVIGKSIELRGNNEFKLDVIAEGKKSGTRVNTGEMQLSPGTYSLVLYYYIDEGGFLPRAIMIDERTLVVGMRKNEISEEDLRQFFCFSSHYPIL